MPYYLNVNIDGLITADSKGDGYTITLKWATAYPKTKTNKIAYNIYMSSDTAPAFPSDFFNMAPSFISFDGSKKVDIVDLIPGQMYHFGVRAFEYNPNVFNPSVLPPAFNGLATFPTSLLASNISATDTVIPLVSAESFVAPGTVKIGAELIFYSAVDTSSNTLLVPGGTSSNAVIVDQGGGHFYTANPSNVGLGTINNLQLVNSNALTETWTIKCVEVLRDGLGNPIPNTARFVVIGSISGSKIGGQEYIWIDDGVVVSNTILSFSITEITPFKEGDSFIIKVAGATPLVGSGRGYNGTVATLHTVDGYDGYTFWDPSVIYWPVEVEEQNTRVFECWNRFDIHHYPFTIVDGYHQKTKDILTTNLTFSDQINTGFPAYDYAGYHRTDPVMLLSGACVGSYIGGYMFCVDGYNGVGQQLRGLPIQTVNMQRQEVLLSTTGEPVCLIQRRWTGITCDCMLPYNEYPEARCNKCYGTGFVVGWQQFFDPRRSDGRIMVRFDPVVDDLVATDSGLESTMQPNCWTLPVPTLKDRDFIVRFDEDGNEEFRYEILNVTRNKLLLDNTGVQKFLVQRIRKTDVIYMVPVFRDTSDFPTSITTSISSSLGIPPHSHTIQINEKIISVSQINEITGVAAGHSHTVQNGVILDEGLGHTHTIIL